MPSSHDKQEATPSRSTTAQSPPPNSAAGEPQDSERSYHETSDGWVKFSPSYGEKTTGLEDQHGEHGMIGDDGQQAGARDSGGDDEEDSDGYQNEDDVDEARLANRYNFTEDQVDEAGADEALETLLGPLADIYGITTRELTAAIEGGAAAGRAPTRGQLVAYLNQPGVSEAQAQVEAEIRHQIQHQVHQVPFQTQVARRQQDRRAPRSQGRNRLPPVPNPAGRKLMEDGTFGFTDPNSFLTELLFYRETAIGSIQARERVRAMMTQRMLPRSTANMIIHHNSPVYSGQFSKDGKFFFSAAQDYKIRLYDTSDPVDWKLYKTFCHDLGNWTITDATLDPDNNFIAYSTISDLIAIAPTTPLDKGDAYYIDLSGRGRNGDQGFHHFGIWSLRFSGDGKQLVAGTNDNCIVVVDIESRTVLHKVKAHKKDVNAVCFATDLSPHVLYSGSDDSTIKIWDRRSMHDKREVGAFAGHLQGLTYVESRGDNRYVLSNGKDQSMKLWDVRMAMTTLRFDQINPTRKLRYPDFDYRYNEWSDHMFYTSRYDNSTVTFRGHQVQQTLIRCHFSPEGSTAGRYVYTGSSDGKVYIYNIDATIAKIIDVRKSTIGTRPLERGRQRVYDQHPPNAWATVVRDASWHPNAPVIAASAWNGHNMTRGTCTVHTWSEMPMDQSSPYGISVDEELKRRPDLLNQTWPLD